MHGRSQSLACIGGVGTDFVYGTAFGDNTFYLKAVDLSGNSSAPSQPIKLFLWPC